MASNNIRSISVGDVTIQSGNGSPDHIAVKGSIYIDMLTAIEYINKDGIAMWVEFLDSTYVFTGGTVSGATFFSGGLSATTFSATTYLGLPTDIFTILSVTGITTSSATLTTSYLYYGVNYNGNVDLITPNPTSNDGFNFNIKDEGGYSGTHRIRITSPIGTIDNNPYVDINLDNMSLHMVARNNNWWII